MNKIHSTPHDSLSGIMINTIENAACMDMKNALSILVPGTVCLYRPMELYAQQTFCNPDMPVRGFLYAAKLYVQQTSCNPDMPVRGFLYAAKLYDKFIHSAKLKR